MTLFIDQIITKHDILMCMLVIQSL